MKNGRPEIFCFAFEGKGQIRKHFYTRRHLFLLRFFYGWKEGKAGKQDLHPAGDNLLLPEKRQAAARNAEKGWKIGFGEALGQRKFMPSSESEDGILPHQLVALRGNAIAGTATRRDGCRKGLENSFLKKALSSA